MDLHNDSVTVSYIILFCYYTISNCAITLIAINVITIVDCTPVYVVFDYRTLSHFYTITSKVSSYCVGSE